MSFPPIWRVPTRVLPSRLSNCAGFGDEPTSWFWGEVISAVAAPIQLASRNAGSLNEDAPRCAKFGSHGPPPPPAGVHPSAGGLWPRRGEPPPRGRTTRARPPRGPPPPWGKKTTPPPPPPPPRRHNLRAHSRRTDPTLGALRRWSSTVNG